MAFIASDSIIRFMCSNAFTRMKDPPWISQENSQSQEDWNPVPDKSENKFNKTGTLVIF